MSERYFYLRELRPDQVKGQGAFPTAWIVEEAELKRRVEWIWLHPRAIFSEITNVLLHGEGKEQDKVKKKPCTCHGLNNPYCPVHGIQVHDVEEFYKEPSPAPTREEWEKWVENMPVTLDCKLDVFNTYDFRAWFLSMPIVPRK